MKWILAIVALWLLSRGSSGVSFSSGSDLHPSTSGDSSFAPSSDHILASPITLVNSGAMKTVSPTFGSNPPLANPRLRDIATVGVKTYMVM